MDELQSVYQQANAAFTGGRYDEAERLFRRLIDAPHRYADVHNKLGLIYSERGLTERAAHQFEQALALNPRYTEAALSLFVTYNELQRFDDAERVFTDAARLVRGAPAALDPFIQGKLGNEHANLGDAYHQLGRYDEALAEYAKAIKLLPKSADVRTRIAVTLREQGLLDEAAGSLTQAIEANPEYVPAHTLLGLVHYSRGEHDAARRRWTEALRLEPSNKAIQAYLRLITTKRH